MYKKFTKKGFQIIMLIIFFISIGKAAYSANVDEMLSDALKKIQPTLEKIPKEIKKVAIYAIEPDTKGEININSLQDQIITALMDSEKFHIIDRNILKALLKEQELSISGVVDSMEMVKTGKLIGVQGFFFGSVEVKKDKVILNLKLIDVESSAIVYSKKFIGESYSYVRVGIGWGYATSPIFGSSFEASLSKDGGGRYVLDSASLDNLQAASIMSFTLSYKQGFKALKFIQFGIDINIASFPSAENNKYNSDNKIKEVNGVTNTFGFSYEINITQFSLKPKFYFSSKALFGWEHDWLNPFVGVSVSFVGFETSWGGSRNEQHGENHEYESKDGSSDPILVISPLFGMEINFTESLTLYFEGVIIQEKECPEVLGKYLAETSLKGIAYIKSGMILNAGVKYYINIF